MQPTILIVIATSAATAVLTTLLVFVVYQLKIKPSLEKQISAAGDEMESRVKQGVISAGEELLPQFRDKVSEGFSKALSEWPTSEMTRVARTGASLVEEGLSTLLGKKRD